MTHTTQNKCTILVYVPRNGHPFLCANFFVYVFKFLSRSKGLLCVPIGHELATDFIYLNKKTCKDLKALVTKHLDYLFQSIAPDNYLSKKIGQHCYSKLDNHHVAEYLN